MSPLDNTHSIPTAAPQAPFAARHIGLNAQDVSTMLTKLDTPSLEALLDEVIPAKILRADPMEIPQALSEAEVLADLAALASQNSARTSLIGMGYYGCHTPPVIQRNVLENPAWYTAYTPYQPEISQGRLEAILNFQTMVTDLTGMDIANGSLLDEATAAAEAMAMAFKAHRGKGNIFRVDPDTHPQTINVLKTRAAPIGVTLEIAAVGTPFEANCFGALISYPGSTGEVRDIKPDIDAIQAAGGMAIIASDLLALCVLESPGSFGADIVLGSAQRFGVPFGYGGHMPPFLPLRQLINAQYPGVLSESVRMRRASKPIALHCRRESSTSAVKRPHPTFVQHRFCWL
jgi:glycine dehydrogenase